MIIKCNITIYMYIFYFFMERVFFMEKKRIAVIFGGKSSEHEVSRVSAS